LNAARRTEVGHIVWFPDRIVLGAQRRILNCRYHHQLKMKIMQPSWSDTILYIFGNCPGWATAIRIGDRLFWTAEAVSDSRVA
jgi:hypothetical protein